MDLPIKLIILKGVHVQTIREVIINQFHEVMEMTNASAPLKLTDDAVLLETGMDSLGFAILVARLEQELGYDPFVLLDTPVYPKTFKDFSEIYERYQDRRTQ